MFLSVQSNQVEYELNSFDIPLNAEESGEGER